MIPQVDDLESDLQGELDLTRCGGSFHDSSRGEVTSWTRKQPRLRIPKIGSVEDVEELGSKLQVSLFGKTGILDQGEIKRRHPWNPQRVASNVAMKTSRSRYELISIKVLRGLSSVRQDGIVVPSRSQIGANVGGRDSKNLPT